MLTATSTLAIFTMLGLSSFAVFWSRRVGLPHTVFLVLLGMILGSAALIGIPGFGFFNEFTLTPELLFYLLLPTLIFESAYNINARRMVEDTVPILLLAVVGLLISTVIIGLSLFYVLPVFGLEVPLIITLLFGALISSTDPVAVLALFKQFGAPRRLSLIFEGESLFNDATSVALFLVILDIVIFGFHGGETILEGLLAFSSMMIGGVIFGLIMGGLFAKFIGLTRENEIASITLTLVLAHATFILSEILSHHLVIGGVHLPLSPIIATTIAALVMGNYGRAKIHPKAEAFVGHLWEQFAFMSNSLIFILIGILFMQVKILDLQMLTVIGVTILVVALTRAISIYPVINLYNRFTDTTRAIPLSWQHLLSWGSLRGALAITMVLLIPEDIVLPGWSLDMSIRDFLLAITVGCIFATLFIKATTIKTVMRKLNLDSLTQLESLEYYEAKALVSHEITQGLRKYAERGYVSQNTAEKLLAKEHEEFVATTNEINKFCADVPGSLGHRSIRIFAIGIEKIHLKELYHHDEINEKVYRRLTGKLQLQLESIERGELAPNMSLHTDGKDIFDYLANWAHNLFSFTPISEEVKILDSLMYYRAQVILSRKVLKELSAIDTVHSQSIFTPEALTHTLSLYTTFKEQSQKKMSALIETNPTITAHAHERLAYSGIHKIEESILSSLYERQLITPKLYITLQEEFAQKHSQKNN